MPRRTIRDTAGLVFHVMNRTANRLVVFSNPPDYEAFLGLMIEAARRVPLRVIAYCLMPNHWHLVVWSAQDGDISQYLQWLSMTHAQRWRIAHGSAGRGAVYQGRFRWVLVESDGHVVRVCRYVEANPVRASLVRRAEQWPWSSLHVADDDGRNCARPVLSEWPVPQPANWMDLVNEEEASTELTALRECVSRGVPYGSERWRETTARALRIPLTGRGRPKRGREVFREGPASKNLPTLFRGSA